MRSTALAIVLLALASTGEGPETRQDLALLDLATLDAHALERSESVGLSISGDALEVRFDSSERMPAVVIPAPQGRWNLAPFRFVALDVANHGPEDIVTICRLNGQKWVVGGELIPAGGSRTVQVIVPRTDLPQDLSRALFGMNGLPGGLITSLGRVDPDRVEALHVHFLNPSAEFRMELRNIRGTGAVKAPSAAELSAGFFPFVDEFGQYMHADWPEKVRSVEELEAVVAAETADLERHPGPDAWNEYGGWTAGPQLEATGHFRTEKRRGQWWLVDPDGRLFWSHGIGATFDHATTPITGREHYFANLPPRAENPDLYSDRTSSPKGHYRGQSFTEFEVSRHNLKRKYGRDWRNRFLERTHERLRSWGMNTVGGWTPEYAYLGWKTPYTIVLGTGGRPIEGSEGNWGKFPDPFDDDFRKGLAERMAAERGSSAEDPFCIGYFVHNELSWNGETYLAESTLASPADQPAKQAFQEYLRKKYEAPAGVNEAWGTDFASWSELLDSRSVPSGARKDLVAFNLVIADQYFKVCEREIHRVAPDKLYMGPRFDFHFYPVEDRAHVWMLPIAGRYCDVISFNRYRYTCAELEPPPGTDKPIIIGEWHIGTLDRGMMHPGLRYAAGLEAQNRLYRRFIGEALDNPFIVGAHWFLYGEQAVSGRFDGENYRVGFLDITDRPYDELVAASRTIGDSMYLRRAR